MKISYYILLLFCWVNNLLIAQEHKSQTEIKLENSGFVDIQSLESFIKVDLKYATKDNFTKTILYDSIHHAYLHPIAAQKLVKAHQLLKKQYPNLSLLVYDAARPISVQQKMYDRVKNTKYHAYVANPSRTGLHNYGMAVDLTICDEKGIPLNMGTPFDYFGRAAGINHEDELTKEGILTKKQVENRQILRNVMLKAGFYTVRGEWWHFNAVPLSTARKSYKIIE